MAENQNQQLLPTVCSTSLTRELHLLMIQFLREEGLHESARSMERESRAFFDLHYLEEKLYAGAFADAEWYIKGYFPDRQQSSYAREFFFEIKRQKYLETVFRDEPHKALDILRNELMPLASSVEDEDCQELALFLSMDEESLNELSERCGPGARSQLCMKIRNMVLACPYLNDKLNAPTIAPFRLRGLLGQSFRWQHNLCSRKQPNPVMTTLLQDHSCPQSGPNFQMFPAGPSVNRAATGTSTSEGIFYGYNMDLTPVLDVLSVLAKRLCSSRFVGSACEMPIQHPPVSSEITQKKILAFNELPSTVIMTLHQGSLVVSMDFHPLQQTLLLVGGTQGEISIWNLCSRERTFHNDFEVWNIGSLSSSLTASLRNESGIFSVRRVIWNNDGCYFAVAYCKHLVQLYKFSNRTKASRFLQIDAHDGGLNDIIFARRDRQLFIVTCGDDHTVKIWNGRTGLVLHTLRSHTAPVLSVCYKTRGLWQKIISASRDGMFKLWTCGKSEPRLELRGPACSAVSMVYTSGTTRLFLCGTITDGIGESFLLEWDEIKGCIMRRYKGLSMQRNDSLQFEVTNGSFLAVGDDSSVKFWDVDNPDMIGSIDAGGGLTALPRIRFNRSGSLLALSAEGNCIKVLANPKGQALLSSSGGRPSSRIQSAPIPQSNAAVHDSSTNISEIDDQSDFLTLKL